jgi:hypothetical protein
MTLNLAKTAGREITMPPNGARSQTGDKHDPAEETSKW